MRLPRKFLKFDYDVQIVFVILISICAVLLPLGVIGFLGLMCFTLLLISWQLISALILVFGYQDKMRVYYLLAATIFAICCYLLNYYSYPLSRPLIFVLPIFAIWYGVLTYKDATYRTPSFWDLEF